MRGLRWWSVFGLAAALFVAQPLAAQETRSVVTTPNADYFGFDLRTVHNVTQDQCEAACLGDSACRALTYNTRAQWCFLKSDHGTLNPFPGAVAGRVVSETAEADIGAPPRLSFITQDLNDEAVTLRSAIQAQPAPGDDEGLAMLSEDARNALENGDADAAAANFRTALRRSPDDAPLWIGLAEALIATQPQDWNQRYEAQRDASAAALNAYRLTRGASVRADALAVLARALEWRELYRPAISAYDASLELVSDGDRRAALEALRETQGFRVVDNTIDTDTTSPRACVQFSEDLNKVGTDYADYVRLDGRPAQDVEAGEREICVGGLRHGESYALALRSGLPSAVGEALRAPVSLDIYVRDRAPSLRFTGDNFVLPATARRGVPVVSVNSETADIEIYRVGDRALARLVTGAQFLRQLSGFDFETIRNDVGEPVWTGELAIESELNREVTTSFPVDEALPDRRPGLYVLSASPREDPAESWDTRATQFFLVSDIGVTTFTGEDGLTVFTRALSSADTIAGVELTLLARNNEVLGTATTDAEGKATFTAGLVRGEAGMAPAVLAARHDDADFVFLDMTRAGFDLSDRGVTGRPAPGALDINAWTERGIYRAGETVHATALARDDAANAVEGLPLTFIFMRPDGAEDRRIVSTDPALGGYAVPLALPANAMRGTWQMRVHADPAQPAIAEVNFLVEDFVPDRIEFDLTAEAHEIAVGEATELTVDGRFLYGAPASGLSLEGEIAVTTTQDWQAHPGFRFGLADEEVDDYANVTPLQGLPLTDEDGIARFDVAVDAVPATTRLLGAQVNVRMREGGGRAVERRLDLALTPQGEMIGIRPNFPGGELPEGSVASFDVIAVAPDGARTPAQDLSWELVRITRNYQWYRQGDSWNYEPVTFTTRVADGTLDVTADAAGRISVPVEWGRYRLEVFSDTAEAASSVEFNAGWFVEATSTETPDGLEIALDRETYAPGDTARLQIAPRFAGKVLVTVGSERLLETFTATVPEDGATLDIPVSEAWGAGAYVTAMLYRPGEAQESRMPMRAIGIKWLSVLPGERRLEVALETPAQASPRGPLTVPLSVPGAADEEAYVTVAAVDIGILNLTNYQAPDPAAWYYGQRRLGLEMRDLYGRLIDGSLGAAGRIRTGGDGGGMAIEGSPPTEELVAYFEGPVQLDAEGRAEVTFDLPQFNGTVRVMAVAWTRDAVGAAQAEMIVRDPLVVTAGLPRFMAPGDTATMRLDIANTDGPGGDYAIEVVTDGPVSADFAETVALQPGERRAVSVPLLAEATGSASLTVRLSHEDGTTVEHALFVPVRPDALPVTTRRVVNLAADGGSLRVDASLLADSVLDGASVSIGVTPLAGFDVASLLMSLDRFPYGCAEQTTSRALPLLYVSELSAQAGIEVDADLRERVQDAIRRVLAYQSPSGSFGLWAPGYGDMWLDAYVSDFLTRAREQDYDIPETAMRLALDNLHNQVAFNVDVTARGAEIAYALYVLSRNRRASAGDLRYYVDTRLGEFASPLARAQLGASLALYGDGERAERAFRSAYQQARTTDADQNRSDYGSALRDGAAMLALAAETRPAAGLIPELVAYAEETQRNVRTESTQEQAWMLLAARALAGSGDAIRLEINGTEEQGAWSRRLDGEEIAAAPLTLVNRGAEAVDAVITTVAAPADPLPAGGDGFSIERTYYTLDGEPANVTEARQNERYVVVLRATEENAWPSRVLVSDLLPAGFQIDNPALVSSAELSGFGWLERTEVAHLEFRDDRFVAAFDRDANSARDMVLAYVVRAVTPGFFAHPAAQIEDMYRPQYSARTAAGVMEVVEGQ